MIILIAILLLSINVFAGDYFPIGKPGANTHYWQAGKCEEIEKVPCFDAKRFNPETHVIDQVVTGQDDYTKPIYEAASNQQACSGLDECSALLEGLCPDTHTAYINQDMTEVYCTKVTGYEKVINYVPREDADLLAAYNQKIADEAQAKADQAAAQQAHANKKAQIAAQCNNLTGVQKLMCEYISE